jgi:hypothetical protein
MSTTANIPDEIRGALSDEKVLQRAVLDAVAALIERAVVGRRPRDAINALERFRRELEERGKQP